MSNTPLTTRVKATLKKSKRPFGIYAIIVLLALIVVNNGVNTLRVLSGGVSETFPDSERALAIVLHVVIAAFCLVLAIGLWKMLEKAWYATMIASGLYLFFVIWRYYAGGEPYVTMVLLVFIVFYLNQREVKKAFERSIKAGAK